jgi:CubicO group peptidase (beta-lactamase class C family)
MMSDDRHERDRRRPSRGAKLADSASARFRDLRGPASVAIVTAFVALAAGGAGPEAPSSLSATHSSAPSGSAAAAIQANAAVDAIFAAWDRQDSPGCALGVVQAGELVYERGYGVANLDWGIPIATDTVFYVGSVSKQFTAAAVALLALDGRISLDDDIREYFPEMPAYERPITVRHLVHHTSGIRDIYTLMSLAGIRLEDVFSDEEAIALIARQRETNFPPGDEHLYSNSGYFLLAQLVERVSGKPLRELAEERIFAPLGMSDTHFHDTPDHIVERRAMSYGGAAGGDEAGPGPDDADPRTFRVSYLGNFDKVGAGGLYTTVQDLLLWDRNFYTGDIGGQAFLELIHTQGVLTDGEPITYAFGLTVDEYRGLKAVSHSGSMMGFKAAYLQLPDDRFSVLIACNLGSIEPMGLARRVAEVYLGDRLAPVEPPSSGAGGGRGGRGGERPAVSLSDEDLEAFAGSYRSAELDVTYDLSVADGNLVVRLPDTPEIRLQPLGGDAFRGRWTFRFERDQAGAVTGFTVDAGRVTNIRFERR